MSIKAWGILSKVFLVLLIIALVAALGPMLIVLASLAWSIDLSEWFTEVFYFRTSINGFFAAILFGSLLAISSWRANTLKKQVKALEAAPVQELQ